MLRQITSRLRHIINYKVLKPSIASLASWLLFKTYHKLQGSQTKHLPQSRALSLRHIINYKVLKHLLARMHPVQGLRHIINYKVLKRLTATCWWLRLFKTYHKLQGSQTMVLGSHIHQLFKTYHKLQGSQTDLSPF